MIRRTLYAAAAALAAPASIGLADAWWYTMFGHQASWLAWQDDTVALAGTLCCLGIAAFGIAATMPRPRRRRR